jgi:hypothetical protein
MLTEMNMKTMGYVIGGVLLGALGITGIVAVIMVLTHRDESTSGIGSIVIASIISIGLLMASVSLLVKPSEEKRQKARERLEAQQHEQQMLREAEILEIRQREKEQEQTRLAREAEMLAHIGAQKAVFSDMSALNENSLALFEKMPAIIRAAENHLDKAEVDFKENAFAPFWESIEKAANTLAQYYRSIRDIDTNFLNFKEKAKYYDGTPPKFPISTRAAKKMVVGKTTSIRLQTLVRQAQKNFQFSMIFEQRKTNKLLVSGFKNLNNALDEMTQSITSAIYDLNSIIDTVSSSIRDSSYELENTMESYQLDQADREEKTIRLLEDIEQKHR